MLPDGQIQPPSSSDELLELLELLLCELALDVLLLELLLDELYDDELLKLDELLLE